MSAARSEAGSGLGSAARSEAGSGPGPVVRLWVGPWCPRLLLGAECVRGWL